MLTQSQKKQLKALASKLDVKYQVGKKEITESLLNMLSNALTAHELIKIDIMKSIDKPIMEIALDLSSKLNADIVQVVGRAIVLYKKNKDKTIIKLVK
ncbi:MAG: YhbY family RNA-binding protein [Bacilli bacterium]|nr:YhbY family RNA-binding protein [Bacilli bacterium]